MFDLAIAKNDLLPPLLMVAGAVDKKQSLPILSNILLKIAENNQLILTATDLEIEISARLACISQCSDESITISAKKCMDILRSLDDDSTPNLSQEGNSLIIKSGRSRFKLASLPASQFPAGEYGEVLLQFALPRTLFMHLLEMTHFAMSQQDVRIFLNGLYLECDEEKITAVATDAHRMAICKITSPVKLPHYRLLLPRKGVLEMLRLLNAITDESIHLVAGNNYFQMNSDHFQFTSKLIEAKFPPYQKLIPTRNDKFVLIDKDSLKRAVTRILILAHEKSRAVLLHIAPNVLTLIANNQENEEAIESIEAQVDGEELKIGINAHYLLDVLNTLPGTTVRLSMSNIENSILVESLEDEEFQYIIMPMKL